VNQLAAAILSAAQAGHITEGYFMSRGPFRGHAALARELGLCEKAAESTSKFARRELQPVNLFCAMTERGLVVRIGMAGMCLQDCLSWVCFKKAIGRLKKRRGSAGQSTNATNRGQLSGQGTDTRTSGDRLFW